jgi:hypothetical protein
MKPPTKFELMRAGRDRADNLRVFADLSAPLPQYVPPAATFMELDGVRYVEKAQASTCDGCAFDDGGECIRPDSYEDKRDTVFGGGCSVRGVIYLKAA